MEEAEKTGISVKGVFAVISGFLINLILGALFSFGNIMPYIASYMREVAGLNVTYSDFASVNTTFMFTNGIVLGLAPLFFIPFVGNRVVLLVSCVCFSLGPVLTVFAMESSLFLVILTYGIVQSIGNMALLPSYTIPMNWFPKKRGTVMGIVVAGYGLSTLVMSPLQLAIANPNDVAPISVNGSEDKYFVDKDVLDRVPTLLYVMSGLYAAVLAFAFITMWEPKQEGDEPDVPWSEKWLRLKETLIYFKSNILTGIAYYLIFITRLGFSLATVSVSTYYKAFALTFIESDLFITTYVGTISGVFACLSSLLYGFVIDHVPYKIVLGTQTTLLAASIGTLYFTANLGDVYFVIWMHFIFLHMQGIFAVIPAKCGEIYGENYGGIVVGTTAFADIFSTLLIESFSQILLNGLQIHYLHYFLFVCVGPLAAFIATMFLPKTKEDQSKWNKILCRKNTSQSTIELAKE